jgi:hypothetical protein
MKQGSREGLLVVAETELTMAISIRLSSILLKLFTSHFSCNIPSLKQTGGRRKHKHIKSQKQQKVDDKSRLKVARKIYSTTST